MIIVIYGLVLLAAALSAQPNVVCSDLLAQVDELQSQLPLDERRDVLTQLAYAAATADPVRTNRWALELFNLAQQMLLGQNRAATQKTALTLLAINDPEHALRLYRHQDLPLSWENPPNAVEDPRALGWIIFNTVWERPDHERYLSKLMSLAGYLGATGEYPYAAMARIANDIANTNARAVARIISDGIRYYKLDAGFQSSPLEYVEFISHTWRHAAPEQLLLAADIGADSVLRMKEDPGGRHYHIEAVTAAGNAEFDSHRAYLLFRLLPYLRQARSQRVEAVFRAYPELRNTPEIGPDTVVRQSGAVSRGTEVPEAQSIVRALNEHRLLEVQLSLDENDLPRASEIASEIADAPRRAVAEAMLARAFASRDRNKAIRLMSASESQLPAALGDIKLRLAGSLAAGYFALGDALRAESLLRYSISVASEIPGMARGEVMGEVGEIIESALTSGADPSHVSGVASTLHDQWLRASILVAAAKSVCRLH